MLEAVGAEGYVQASVRSVLGRTGLYRQAFYDHFADKQDCYLQAYDAGLARVESRLREAADGAGPWRAELRAGLAAALELLEAEPDLGRALLVEVHAAGPEALAKRDAAVRRFATYLDRAPGNGAAPPPAIASEAIAAGIYSVLHARLAARQDDGFHELLPEFMYIAVLPYFGADAASGELYGGAR